MLKGKINICNFYILLWCLYLSQGSLGIRGTWISQLFLLIILAITVFNLFYAVQHYNIRPFLKTALAFLTVLSVYGIVVMLNGERIVFGTSLNLVNKSSYLKNNIISILPLFSFYVYARRGLLTEESMKNWTWVLLLVATLYFYYLQEQALQMALMAGSNREEFTNNSGYLFASLLSFAALFYDKQRLQFALMGYCILFLLSGMKRGAILIGFIVMAFIVFNNIRHNKGLHKTKSLILTLLLVLFGTFSIYYFIQTSDYFNSRIIKTLEGDTSSRVIIYSTLYDHLTNRTRLLEMLFGSGALSTIRIAGNYAHNDWLELATNQGLLGLVIYVVYWINAYGEWRRSNKSQPYSVALGTLLISLFLQSLFSMSYGNMEFYTTMLLGYCLAQNHKCTELRRI